MEADVGRRVRQVRRVKDVTQAQLAVQAGLNVITISRLENGTAKVVYGDTIVALARALGVSADYLLGLSEPQAVPDPAPDPAHVRRMIQEEMRTVIAHAQNIIDAIDTAESVTDTVTDTDAPQKPPRRRKRQPAPAD